MRIMKGVSLGGGDAMGRLRGFRREMPAGISRLTGTPEGEICRLREAVRSVDERLAALEECPGGHLFGVQRALLWESRFQMRMATLVGRSGLRAESAVTAAGRDLGDSLALLSRGGGEGSTGWSGRADDVCDLVNRLTAVLRGHPQEFRPEPDQLLILPRLTAGEAALLLDRSWQGAVFLSRETADLMQNACRPMILLGGLPEGMSGRTAILSGSRGTLLTDPDGETAEAFRRDAASAEPCPTRGKDTFAILGAVRSPAETAAAVDGGGGDLVWSPEGLTDEEWQTVAKQIGRAAGKRRVWIRGRIPAQYCEAASDWGNFGVLLPAGADPVGAMPHGRELADPADLMQAAQYLDGAELAYVDGERLMWRCGGEADCPHPESGRWFLGEAAKSAAAAGVPLAVSGDFAREGESLHVMKTAGVSCLVVPPGRMASLRRRMRQTPGETV